MLKHGPHKKIKYYYLFIKHIPKNGISSPTIWKIEIKINAYIDSEEYLN